MSRPKRAHSICSTRLRPFPNGRPSPSGTSAIAWGTRVRSRPAKLSSTRTRSALAAVRKLDDTDSHLGLASVVGDLRLFARAPVGLDMIAIKPRLWSSSETLLENYAYLVQRRESTVGSNLGALFWAWIPAVAPPGVARNIWGDDTPPDSAWAVPPIQPAQLRLMTYLALSAGYRGLVFQGDAGLTRKAGEVLRIEMSFLNLEIDLFEAILAENVDPIRSYSVFDPNPPVIPPNSTKQRRPKSVPELPPRPGMLAAAVPLRERKGHCSWSAITPIRRSSSRPRWPPTKSGSFRPCLRGPKSSRSVPAK